MTNTPIIKAPDADLGFIDELRVAKAKQGHRYKSKRRFLDIITAFDIETSLVEIDGTPHSFMYIWQWHFGDKMTVIGRTWDEFMEFYNRLTCKLSEDRMLLVYVHNLSHEFAYLAGVLDMNSAEIFATEQRKVLYFRLDGLEFRCSMRLANCSLDSWTKQLDVDHKKLSGEEFDYSVVRYPWTELTDRQLAYCVNDVVGLVECVEKTLDRFDDSLYSVPLTSTGYIRRMVKNAVKYVQRDIAKQQNSLEIYDALRLAYRGGDTHANRYEVGGILGPVYSYDRSSSYPDVMLHCKYPVTKFRPEAKKTLDWCAQLTKWGRCYLAKVELIGVEVKSWNTCPYISLSKCWGEGLATPINYRLDNGRVLTADLVQMWVTDVDLALLINEYDYKQINILELYSARYGYLPQPIRDVIKQLYKDKTELKGVEGEEERYMMAKQLLNSVYGMMCQRVITPAVVYSDGKWAYDMEYNRQEEYDKEVKKAFLNYAWGVWVCAWARYRLHEGISAAGWENFVYCDTDSVKSMMDLNIKTFNDKRVQDAKKSGGWAVDPKGNVHYMGVFEKEDTYDEFITLGAKRYAYKIDGKIGMTVAGVSKKRGYKELEKMGGLKAFREGVTFYDAGHISAFYNDDDNFDLTVEGRIIHIGRNVSLVERPYTMTLARDLHEMMKNLEKALDKQDNKDYNDSAFSD